MRITQAGFYNKATEQMNQQQAKVFDTQSQLSSGKKMLRPSDDPALASAINNLGSQIDINKRHLSNLSSAEGTLKMQEASVGGAVGIVARIKELSVQGANDSYSAQDRKIIALEVKELISALVDLGNMRGTDGAYLFSGFNQDKAPFNESALGVVTYTGSTDNQKVMVGEGRSMKIGMPGSDVFGSIDATGPEIDTYTFSGDVAAGGTISMAEAGGKTYTQAFVTSHQDTLDALVIKINAGETDLVAKRVDDSIVYTSTKPLVPLPDMMTSGTTDGLTAITDTKIDTAASTGTITRIDMFETLNAMHKALDTNNASDIRNTLDKITSVHEHVNIQQAKIGSRLKRVESLSIANEDRDYAYQILKSGMEDLNYVEAASRLKNQTLALQAGQQTFAQLSGLSLFKYIS